LNEKFHNSSTRNRRNDLFTPCVRCCCSFPLCYFLLLLLFSFDFIISKVTALGARTTTTFYLMSWFWLLIFKKTKQKRGRQHERKKFAHRFRFFPAIIQIFLCLNGKRNLFTVKKTKKLSSFKEEVEKFRWK
jgi:hypothetical protein